MNKTKCPEKYLDKALKILEECEKYGVWIKFNILFYAGETHKTIEETKNWLKKYKHLIKGISVSSLVYYQGAGKLEDLLDAGAKLPSENALLDCGYVDLDLSDEISSEEAKKIAIQISQNQMSQKDYFDIKSVSYFKRGYTYEEFEQDIKKCNPMELPFEIIK